MSTGRLFALLFGFVFLLIGIAGYMPQLVQGNLLFGLFQVDEMHNNVHILSGIIAILASLKGNLSRLYFKIFGIVYLIVTIMGFVYGEFLMMPLNMADNYLHLFLTLVFLFLGFIFKKF